MLGAIALVFHARRQRGGARVRVRRGRRLVPRLLHAGAGRGARPEGRRRHRLPRRARRRDHRRASCSRRGASCRGRSTCSPRPPGSPSASGSGRCAPSCAAASPGRRYAASTSVLAPTRKDVLVRMPGELKRRLADEVRRSGRSLNDVAVGILASRFAVAFEPSGRAGKPPRRGRVGAPAHAGRAEGQARRARGAAQAQRQRPDRRDALGAARKGTRWHTTERQGAARARTRSASRSSASATARTRCSRASSTTRTRRTTSSSPASCTSNLGGYHVRDIEFVAAFDVTKDKVGKDLADAIWAHPNDTIKFADVPKTGVTVSRGMTHDGIGKYLSRGRREGAGRDRRRRRDPQGAQRRRRRQLPPRRLGDGDEVVRGADPRRRLRDGELHAGVHRPRGVLAAPLRAGRRADHRRRHQVAGRRDDHAPRAHVALPRARRAPRQDDAAERRRQLATS